MTIGNTLPTIWGALVSFGQWIESWDWHWITVVYLVYFCWQSLEKSRKVLERIDSTLARLVELQKYRK